MYCAPENAYNTAPINRQFFSVIYLFIHKVEEKPANAIFRIKIHPLPRGYMVAGTKNEIQLNTLPML